MISFGTTYWFIFLLAVVFAAAGITFLLYFRNRKKNELTKIQSLVLMVLRFLSVFLIAFLLLSPFLRSLKKITQNPVIITAWDNSKSIISTRDSQQVATEINRLKNEISEKLGEEYTLVNYEFGETTDAAEALDFTEKKSDYSEMISTVASNHFNENVGALIIAGDGIYNQGKNPVNLTDEIDFPVYTLGLGDTTEVTDSRIQTIRANRTSFSGNSFPVEIDVQFSKLKGKPLTLLVKQNETELARTVITPPNEDYFITQQFILEAGKPGLKHYTVTVQPVENERNTKNNSAGFVINVLENKQKILILSDGPHPDIGAIKNTLEEQQTYEVTIFTQEPYPSNLSDFNLLVLNQLPTAAKSMATVIETAAKNRIPVLFIIGKKTFLPQFNSLTQGAEIKPLAGSLEEVQATINPTYATFTLSEEFREMLPKFPPMLAPFADYQIDPGINTLFYQRIKNIETTKPLLATGTLNGRKTGYIFGEGIWRWRLYNYYFNQSHIQFNELVNHLIQYLALRENEDNFIVDFQPVYDEINNIILNAEVYNDAFERITSEEVNISIKNENGDEFEYAFDVKGDSYQLNAGKLPTGDYTFTAEVTIGNETFTETGSFTVVPVNFENIVTRANHQVLFQLASGSGGKFYLPGNTQQLIDDLKNSNQLKPVNYFQEAINELLNLRWLFFVFLLLLSVEWFLRKFWGIY